MDAELKSAAQDLTVSDQQCRSTLKARAASASEELRKIEDAKGRIAAVLRAAALEIRKIVAASG